jgi:peptide/nickel transport system substrate-binding protein
MWKQNMLRKLVFINIGLFCIGLMLISGLSEAATNVKPTAKSQSSAVKPKYGGVLKIIMPMSVVNLGCPWEKALPTDSHFRQPVMETLVRCDEKGLPVPWLATSWNLSKDRGSVTFTLRKNVKFHDGEEFNADAVKANFDMVRVSPNVPVLKEIESIDVLDKYTVRLNLSRFEPAIFNVLASGAANLISPAAIKKGKEYCLTYPVGTGPFKMGSFQRDVALRYERFDGYWQKGKPYLDAIEWTFIADRVAAQMAFKAGQGQAIYGINPADAADLQTTGKYTIVSTPSAVFGLVGDTGNTKSPLANIKVRRAIEHAINKEEITKAMGYGFYKTTNQPAPRESWYYNTKVVGYSYNPKKAKELLVQAGYPNGFKTRIIIQTTTAKDVYVAVQSDLAQVGIDAKVEVVSPASYVEIQTKGWDNALLYYNIPMGIGQDPGQALGNNLSSRGRYFSIVHPAAYEKKLSMAITELDNKKRAAMFQDLMKTITDDQAMIHLIYLGMWISAKTPELRDARLSEFWFQQWTPEDAWLNK